MSVNLDNINQISRQDFVQLLGGIFEHSPWVAELAYTQRPFKSGEQLHRVMLEVVRQASAEQHRELLCSHPELAGKEAEAGSLTDDSKREQAGAGLNQCSSEELKRINSFNQAYMRKFAFPFIIAVTGLNKLHIMDAMEKRLNNNVADEFATALGEVEKIARIRLDALIDE
jgi:2-oxo-4-hydroxy-4-carboxy-5-ureidoimidazoline decarboxylase